MSDTARQRLVESMQAILEYKVRGTDIPLCQEEVRQAIDAFADAECSVGDLSDPWCDNQAGHAACRATLRAECGL